MATTARTAKDECRRYALELQELRAALPPEQLPQIVEDALGDAVYELEQAARTLHRLDRTLRAHRV